MEVNSALFYYNKTV